MTIKSKKGRIWLTVLLGMLTAMAPLSTDMYLPSLPVMAEAFGVGPSLIQLTLTMSMVGMAIGQLAAGPISDQRGRRWPLILGMLVFAASSLGCVFAESIYWFLGFRLIQGLAGAVGIVVAKAIARDVCEGVELTRFFALLMLVNGLAPIIAPVIGGQVLLFASWRGIFVLLVAIGAVLMLASAVQRETLPASRRIHSLMASFRSFGRLFSDRYFMGHCLMQCWFFGAFFAYISGSSFLFQNVYHISAQAFSVLFGGIGAAIAVCGIVPARLAGRVSDVHMLVWSLVQALVGGVLFFVCCWLRAPFALTVAALLVTIPMISVLGAASFSLAMRAQGKNAGSAAALIGFFSMISGGVMAPLVGIGGSADPMPMAVIMVAGQAGALVCYWIMIRPSHQQCPR